MRERQYQKFAAKMRKSESSGDYQVVNRFGFMGAYQFGKPRLWDMGYSVDGWTPKWWSFKRLKQYKVSIVPKSKLLQDEQLQDDIFRQHVNKCIKRVSKYGNRRINGTAYTISAFVGVMHLLGYGGVKKLVRGKIGADANGTTALDYANKFNNMF